MLLTVAEVEGQTVKYNGRSYTHVGEGMLWRYEGAAPISQLADEVMDECFLRHGIECLPLPRQYLNEIWREGI